MPSFSMAVGEPTTSSGLFSNPCFPAQVTFCSTSNVPLVGTSMSNPPLPMITFPVYSMIRPSMSDCAGITLYGSLAISEPSVLLRKTPVCVHCVQVTLLGGAWRAARTAGWSNHACCGGSEVEAVSMPLAGRVPRTSCLGYCQLCLDAGMRRLAYEGHGHWSVMWYQFRHGLVYRAAATMSSNMLQLLSTHESLP